MKSNPTDKLKLNILAFTTILIWATAFPFTKMIGTTLSPGALGLIRCFAGSLVLIAAGIFSHMKKPACLRDVLLLAASGASGFAVYMILFNTGMKYLTSATSSVIIAATPILTAAAASFIYKEKIRPAGWICIFSAFAGVVILLFWNGVLSVNAGMCWTLGASVVFCIYNLLNRKLSSLGYSALEIVTYSMISSTVFLLPFAGKAVSEISAAGTPVILTALYLGVMSSAFSYLMWAKALSYAEHTNQVTNYMFVTPLLSAVLGFVLLKEMPDTGTCIGGVVIIISLIVFNLQSQKKQ